MPLKYALVVMLIRDTPLVARLSTILVVAFSGFGPNSSICNRFAALGVDLLKAPIVL